LTEYNGKKQLKCQMLISKAGAPYIQVDSYKPDEQPAPVPDDDPGLPF